MGSSFSSGREYSPRKTVSDKTPKLKHAKHGLNDAEEENTEYVERFVCKAAELRDDEMKVFDFGKNDDKVLLVKKDGVITALGTKCTHYGAPLINGYLGENRIRCQWHGACFNIKNGDIEDFPGLDSVPCFEVKISEGNVIVRANKEQLLTYKRPKPFPATIYPNKSTFLVVGGGPSSAVCVENLRALGYDGRLVFIMAEHYLPYDRVKLSKALDTDGDKIALRTRDFYLHRNIELKPLTLLEKLNPKDHIAYLSNGENIKYDKIYLATGSSPRRLRAPGSHLNNIFYLRKIDDAKDIKAALLPKSNVIILGTSFIGMELASFLVAKVASITVIGRSPPFKPLFGDAIGNRIVELYREKNVQFQLNQTITEFEGQNDKLTSVVLKNGTKLPADVCVIAIGCFANLSYLNDYKIKSSVNCSIEVNEFMETQFPNVYAGGDIALAPLAPALKEKAVIGHWGLASYHGYIAAHNMMGQAKPLKAVPFFWTMLCGKALRFAGHAPNFDDVIIDGSLEELKFIAFYCCKKEVLAVSSLNRDPLAAKFAEMLYEGKKLLKTKIHEFLIE